MPADTTALLNYYANWFAVHPILGALFLLCTLALKGVALWKAAEREQRYWFVAILVINTFGILDAFYIYFVARKYNVEIIDSTEN